MSPWGGSEPQIRDDLQRTIERGLKEGQGSEGFTPLKMLVCELNWAESSFQCITPEASVPKMLEHQIEAALHTLITNGC